MSDLNEIPIAGGEEPDFFFYFCPEEFAEMAGCSIEDARMIWDEKAVDGVLVLENTR